MCVFVCVHVCERMNVEEKEKHSIFWFIISKTETKQTFPVLEERSITLFLIEIT